MINKMRKIRNVVLSLLLCFSLYGCGIYSFSGTSIQPDVKTIAVEYFQNNALKVNPTLAANLTDALIDQYRRLTSLDILTENGDMNVSGEITSYDTRPMAVTADEVASQNRLTVTVKI